MQPLARFWAWHADKWAPPNLAAHARYQLPFSSNLLKAIKDVQQSHPFVLEGAGVGRSRRER